MLRSSSAHCRGFQPLNTEHPVQNIDLDRVTTVYCTGAKICARNAESMFPNESMVPNETAACSKRITCIGPCARPVKSQIAG